jgi:hypothetical protein
MKMAGFIKGVRKKVHAKVLLSGPSGAGKSQSSCELATGLFRKAGGTGIAYIGTEGDRDLLYAQTSSKHGDYTFEYDILQLTDPFTTEKYIAAIDTAIDAGYKVCIIDGLSAEWKWLNDTHDKMPGNSFTNWGKLKPKHRMLIDKILTAPMHIICCARGKDEWLLEDRNGKSIPRKVGMGSQTDKDISYEVMLSLQIEQDTHLAHADKDNTNLWPETRYSVITAKDGEALYDWCEKGEMPEPKPVIQKTVESEDDLKSLKSQIISLAKELGGTTNEAMMATIKEYVSSGNPNAIKEVSVAKELLTKMEALR